MKRLLPLLLIMAGSLFASSAYSQIRIHASIHLPVPPLPPIPHVHVYAQPIAPAPVVYQENYAPAPYYNGYSNERVVVAAPRYDYGYDRFHDRRHEVYVEHRGCERRDRRGW